ncbi:haloacid dehalogenase [Legionella qingyii]|uniref:Haloacid dehalogenase n=1 Tax=Legionella qingyii TaxID=2184757 RepID=A0A317U6A5_9GAMM|nr:HAD hydrolase-like protein [Legionella qingyii]PWY56718.1 haloacid dehalogenase [Legionella qingyii]RUR23727.1 haloacid dehalogenase [Legionella qingyii]RUR26309.1 haloacid dehalogenase [Legionella qingyii]
MINRKFNLIFDFDGTLADSFPIAIEQLTLLANELNLRKIEPSELEILRNLTSKELIHYLKIPFYKLPYLMHRAREQMKKEIPILSTFIDLPEVLNELKRLDCAMGIVTSNSLANVSAWLEQHQMQNIFNFIHAESSYFGKGYLLKKAIKSYSMKLDDTFYIGDETRDIEAAKKCHIHSIAVTWGFNSESLLTRYNPTHIARNPQNILTIVNELF